MRISEMYYHRHVPLTHNKGSVRDEIRRTNQNQVKKLKEF